MGVITLVLIVANLQAAGTASFFTGIKGNPAIPEQVSSNAQVKLVSGSPSLRRRPAHSTPGCRRGSRHH